MERNRLDCARDELGNLVRPGDIVRFRVTARLTLSRDLIQMREGRIVEIYLDAGLPRLSIDTGDFRYLRPSMLCRKIGE